MTRCIMVFLYKWENGELRFLLLKRNSTLGGYWQPVTGFIEEPETNREAALRELGEETGIVDYERITDPKHFFLIDMHGIQCSVYVLAVEVSDPPTIKISYEHTEHQWLSYQNARNVLYWENNVETLDKLHTLLMAKKNGSA